MFFNTIHAWHFLLKDKLLFLRKKAADGLLPGSESDLEEFLRFINQALNLYKAAKPIRLTAPIILEKERSISPRRFIFPSTVPVVTPQGYVRNRQLGPHIRIDQTRVVRFVENQKSARALKGIIGGFLRR